MILLLLKTMNTLTLRHREELKLLVFFAGPTWAGGELGPQEPIIGGVSSPAAVVARALAADNSSTYSPQARPQGCWTCRLIHQGLLRVHAPPGSQDSMSRSCD